MKMVGFAPPSEGPPLQHSGSTNIRSIAQRAAQGREVQLLTVSDENGRLCPRHPRGRSTGAVGAAPPHSHRSPFQQASPQQPSKPSRVSVPAAILHEGLGHLHQEVVQQLHGLPCPASAEASQLVSGGKPPETNRPARLYNMQHAQATREGFISTPVPPCKRSPQSQPPTSTTSCRSRRGSPRPCGCPGSSRSAGALHHMQQARKGKSLNRPG